MSFKTIFFLMFAILVLLFIVNFLNRKKSKNLSLQEALYFEKVLAFKKQPSNTELLEQARQAAQAYAQAKGLSQKEAQAMVQNDLGQE